MQDEADALVAAAAANAGNMYACSHAKGTSSALASINAAWDETSIVAGSAASAMRLALSLPIDRG
jgi:hypothetical protein